MGRRQRAKVAGTMLSGPNMKMASLRIAMPAQQEKWEDALEDQPWGATDLLQPIAFSDGPDQIDRGLFIGSAHIEQRKANVLRKHNITHILQVAHDVKPTHVEEGSFQYLHLSLQDRDWVSVLPFFPAAFSFIDEALAANGGVLVHCVAGISRSAAFCIGWLMWTYKITYDEAFERVKKVRPFIQPNPGFEAQLRHFQELGYDLSALQSTA